MVRRPPLPSSLLYLRPRVSIPLSSVGGRINQAGTTARLGKSEYMVVEADESDGSSFCSRRVVAVVTTIDREHLDYYASLDEIQDTFVHFVNRVPFYGAAILCLDEPNVQAILPRVTRPVITYGVFEPSRFGDQRTSSCWDSTAASGSLSAEMTSASFICHASGDA